MALPRAGCHGIPLMLLLSLLAFAAALPQKATTEHGPIVPKKASPRLMRKGAAHARAIAVEAAASMTDMSAENQPSNKIGEAPSKKIAANATHHLLPMEHLNTSSPTKLFVIVTGDKPHGATLAQDSWIRHLRQNDRAIFACGVHCREDPRLESVVIVPDLLLDKNNTQPWDYRQAAMRGPWALQWAWNNLQRMGSGSQGADVSDPENAEKAGEEQGYGMQLASHPFAWWIIGDDDTFVNLPVLEKVLARYSSDDPVAIVEADRGGGAGLVLSRAATKLFTAKFWTKFFPAMRDRKGRMWGDTYLLPFLKLQGVRLEVAEEFTQIAPSEVQLTSGKYQKEVAMWHHAWADHQPKDYEAHIYNNDPIDHGLKPDFLPLPDRKWRDRIEHAPSEAKNDWEPLPGW